MTFYFSLHKYAYYSAASHRQLAIAVYCLLDTENSVVGLSVSFVNAAKTAEPMKMLFDTKTLVSPTNHALDKGADSATARDTFAGSGFHRESL